MTDKKCKICRRVGEKLFLKGERCFTPKCCMNKRPYPPGKLDSEKKHRSSLSEYGILMKEKQKIKNIYGVMEKQFSNYVRLAEKDSLIKKIHPTLLTFILLESRLDNAVFRIGLAKSRSFSRQIVSHGHILVNGKKINVASHQIKIGDIISIREGSKNNKIFSDLTNKLKDVNTPDWISLDISKGEAKISALPKEIEQGLDFTKVLEFYNK